MAKYEKRGIEFENFAIQIQSDHRKNHFFGVGINEYIHHSNLKNCVNDVEQIIKILTTKFQFEISNTKKIHNHKATRKNIKKELREFVTNIDSEDNLLVYFAGHGIYDPITEDGYWIPHDAPFNDIDEYISNSEILPLLDNKKIHHLILLVDSCFAGSGTIGTRRSNNNKNIDFLHSKSSRWVLTSCTNEEAIDYLSTTKRKENSPFAASLLNSLGMSSQPIGIRELGLTVRKEISELGQNSNVERIKSKKSHNGEFFFKTRTNSETFAKIIEKHNNGAVSEAAEMMVKILKVNSDLPPHISLHFMEIIEIVKSVDYLENIAWSLESQIDEEKSESTNLVNEVIELKNLVEFNNSVLQKKTIQKINFLNRLENLKISKNLNDWISNKKFNWNLLPQIISFLFSCKSQETAKVELLILTFKYLLINQLSINSNLFRSIELGEINASLWKEIQYRMLKYSEFGENKSYHNIANLRIDYLVNFGKSKHLYYVLSDFVDDIIDSLDLLISSQTRSNEIFFIDAMNFAKSKKTKLDFLSISGGFDNNSLIVEGLKIFEALRFIHRRLIKELNLDYIEIKDQNRLDRLSNFFSKNKDFNFENFLSLLLTLFSGSQEKINKIHNKKLELDQSIFLTQDVNSIILLFRDLLIDNKVFVFQKPLVKTKQEINIEEIEENLLLGKVEIVVEDLKIAFPKSIEFNNILKDYEIYLIDKYLSDKPVLIANDFHNKLIESIRIFLNDKK